LNRRGRREAEAAEDNVDVQCGLFLGRTGYFSAEADVCRQPAVEKEEIEEPIERLSDVALSGLLCV
jgi:hypothetical protein